MCGREGLPRYPALRDRVFDAPGEWRLVRCADDACGTLWLDPAPHPDDLHLAYRRYYTHAAGGDGSGSRPWFRWAREGFHARRFGYPSTGSRWPRAVFGWAASLWPDTREYLEQRVMLLPHRPGGRLLDVGCGNGHFLTLMRELGWRGEGVDFDASAIEAARAAGLEVRLGGLAEQRYPDATFDAVTLNHVIEHLPDPLAVLRECRRVLTAGGQLTLATPNAESEGHATFGEHWRGLEPPRHLQLFSGAGLRRALEQAGFPQVALHTSVQLARSIYRESRAIRARAQGRTDRAGRLACFGFVAREVWARRRRPGCGEELVAVARP